MRLITAIFAVTLMLVACGVEPQIAQQEEAEARNVAAAAVATALLTDLATSLGQHMSRVGPAGAIAVCRDIAPAAARDLSLTHGWKITRIGTRVRNPLLGTPDAWEQTVLEEFAQRARAGEALQAMSFSEVVSEGSKRYFRYLKPIVLQPQCLSCHGAHSEIPRAVQEMLSQQYPHDQATGYATGDLRGAVSIKQPLLPRD